MSQTDSVFTGSIPKFYDTYLVPLIFQSFARDLAARVADHAPQRILETAAGSGVVARAMAENLGADAEYIVTDLNQPMLDHAKSVQPADARMSWQAADALALPFDAASFDAVICQFGVMFFPDRIEGYRETRRVLRPGGAFIFNVWDRIETNEFADVVTRAAATVFPDDPPVFMARTPHGYADKGLIETELNSAGFSNVSIDTRADTSTAASAHDVAIAYCQGTPLRNEILDRDADGLERVTDVAARAIKDRWGSGPVSAKIQGHVITARP